MKIEELHESTTSGSVAPVAAPMNGGGAIKRGTGVYPNKKGGNLLTGKKTNKKYANAMNEAPELKSKQQCIDYFVKRGKTAAQGAAAWERGYRGGPSSKEKAKTADNKQLNLFSEAQLEEEDLILVPGQGHRLKTGFHAFDPDKAEHEGETLKNSLRTIIRNAKELHGRLENSDQFPEWVSEKIGQIKGMMTGVTEYLISSQEEHEPEQEGVIAGGAGNFEEASDPIAKRITVKKWGGDDKYSWAVLVDGRPAVTGLGKNEVPYYKNMILKKLREKPQLTGSNLEEEGKGLWANIHAKRERIKHGSGERMRNPGSKGAPSSQDFKDAANEGASEPVPHKFKLPDQISSKYGIDPETYNKLATMAMQVKQLLLRGIHFEKAIATLNIPKELVDTMREGAMNSIRSKFFIDDVKEYQNNQDMNEGIVDKIKGAVRREKAKDMPLVQTRRDYAMGKAGDSYEKGQLRKGNQYNAWAERDRKKMGHPTTNPAGTYRTKTTDYTNESKYGKGMRDCCDSPAQKNQPHVKGCKNYSFSARDRRDEMERHNIETIPGYKRNKGNG